MPCITLNLRSCVADEQGGIQNTQLPPGSPDWDTIRKMTWGAIVAAAKEGKPGYQTIKKLLCGGRFDK